MKRLKLGVILLALLLAGMAMVPCSGAAVCESSQSYLNNSIRFDHPGHAVNLFDEMGLERPAEPAIHIPFRSYAESREVADRILSLLSMPGGQSSVIGVYDLGASKIMIVSKEDSVLEAVYDGKSVKTYSHAPVLLGEKKYSTGPEPVISTSGMAATLATEASDRLYSVTLQGPGDDTRRPLTILTTYIVKKSRTDVYRSGLVDIASLHTEGWFYVNYGSSITAIGDYSTYWVTSLPFWQACSFSTENLGVGSTYGQHKTHLKFGAPYVRDTMDMWVSCDAWLNANDGGFTNSWSSANGDACS